jgi:hypothetical protein
MSEPTRVQWSLGYTLNVGNFQSIRIDCQVSDSAHDGESASDASTRVYKFVENELIRKIKEAKKELDGE